MAATRGNVNQGSAVARSGQDDSAVVIGNSVAPASEAAAGGTPADLRSVHGTGDGKSHRSTSGVDVRQEGKDEDAQAAPGLGGQVFAAVADAGAILAPAQVGSDGIAKVKEVIKKLNAVNLALHGELVAEKSPQARA